MKKTLLIILLMIILIFLDQLLKQEIINIPQHAAPSLLDESTYRKDN